jgi:putative (di)nucleoside polyphosphate hydrolase
VGAIIKYKENFLLVHKVRIMDIANSPVNIKGEWNLVIGGIQTNDKSKEDALFRELKEETGSGNYTVVKECSEKLRFDLSGEFQQTGYSHQETSVFIVEFNGNFSTLKPNNQEIDQIAIFSKEEVYTALTHLESKEYFRNLFLDNFS